MKNTLEIVWKDEKRTIDFREISTLQHNKPFNAIYSIVCIDRQSHSFLKKLILHKAVFDATVSTPSETIKFTKAYINNLTPIPPYEFRLYGSFSDE